MNNFIVHHRSFHHASYSGYARLIDFIDDAKVIEGEDQIPYRLAKLVGDLSNQKAGMYNSQSVQKEIDLYKQIKNLPETENSIVHYLNGERDIRYLLKFNKYKNINFCASFHKPPEVLKSNIKKTNYLEKLNGAICVGQNQVDFLKSWLNLTKVNYIPHGVDTVFFKPLTQKKFSKKMLFVGQHLRDFDMLNHTLPRILAEDSQSSIDIVLKKKYINKIEVLSPRVRLHTGVDDIVLKKFYQEASFLYLPMLDSTACNSILEALACGLPIITSKVGGNKAYLNGSENILVHKDEEDNFIQKALYLLKNEDKCSVIGEQSRKLSLNYDWEIIGKQVMDFYNSIRNQ